MRKLLAFPLLVYVLIAAGCDNPAGTERRNLAGTWASVTVPGATLRMTITEVARSVQGAGSWLDPNQAIAFRVSGAHAEEVVSLLFEFESIPDVNFSGQFSDANTLQGTLTGGTFRALPVTFVREQTEE